MYATSPLTGAEFWADMRANAAKFAGRHRDRAEAAEIAAAIISDGDEDGHDDLTAYLRRILPAYFADYWARESEFAPLRAAVRIWPGPTTGAPFDFRDALRRLDMPATIIAGAHDFICGPRWARMLHDALAGSQLFVLADSGHLPHIEQEHEFTMAVTSSLGPGQVPLAANPAPDRPAHLG